MDRLKNKWDKWLFIFGLGVSTLFIALGKYNHSYMTLVFGCATLAITISFAIFFQMKETEIIDRSIERQWMEESISRKEVEELSAQVDPGYDTTPITDEETEIKTKNSQEGATPDGSFPTFVVKDA